MGEGKSARASKKQKAASGPSPQHDNEPDLPENLQQQQDYVTCGDALNYNVRSLVAVAHKKCLSMIWHTEIRARGLCLSLSVLIGLYGRQCAALCCTGHRQQLVIQEIQEEFQGDHQLGTGYGHGVRLDRDQRGHCQRPATNTHCRGPHHGHRACLHRQ